MLNLTKIKIFLVIFVLVFSFSITFCSWSDNQTIDNNVFTTGSSQNSDVVLNEIMADPAGNDDDPMPGGEWVELYNTGNWPIDVDGWYLYDFDDHDLPINSSNISGGSTIIAAHGYIVVYRNGDGSFSLNNGGDVVKLYDASIDTGTLLESAIYAGSTEDKTWAKVPNGTGGWIADQNPTPGGSN